MKIWCLLLAVIVASWGLTLVLRRYALAKSLIDIPNERSSHSVPTPRGGGVAIVASFLLALPILTAFDLLSSATFCGLFGSGLLVAVIGFADDHGHIAARWRLLGHFIAAAWALYWLEGFPPIEFFGVTVDLIASIKSGLCINTKALSSPLSKLAKEVSLSALLSII